MKENNNAFDVRNLDFWYGDKKVLKKVSLEIMKNNIVSLIGPSGCGKSTFLRCLNKMNDLTPGVKIEGSIIFDNQHELIQSNKNKIFKFKNKSNNITPLELRTRVGMVFQKPNPFTMSIYDNVAFGPRSCGIRKKKELDRIVKQALKDAALWQEVKNSLHEPALSLSGGQQQRLCIARTIAMHPEVILMDEPTSALDPIATGKIEELIIKLKKKYSIVIVTHSMQQAKRLSDQVAFFYLGAIKESGSVKKVFENPQHKFTQNYLSGNFG